MVCYGIVLCIAFHLVFRVREQNKAMDRALGHDTSRHDTTRRACVVRSNGVGFYSWGSPAPRCARCRRGVLSFLACRVVGPAEERCGAVRCGTALPPGWGTSSTTPPTTLRVVPIARFHGLGFPVQVPFQTPRTAAACGTVFRPSVSPIDGWRVCVGLCRGMFRAAFVQWCYSSPYEWASVPLWAAPTRSPVRCPIGLGFGTMPWFHSFVPCVYIGAGICGMLQRK